MTKITNKEGKEIRISGLKKAVGEYQRYNDHFRFRSTLEFDESDGEIWCDTFIDSGSYKVYHSDTIHRIDSDILEMFGKVTMKTVREYIAATF